MLLNHSYHTNDQVEMELFHQSELICLLILMKKVINIHIRSGTLIETLALREGISTHSQLYIPPRPSDVPPDEQSGQ